MVKSQWFNPTIVIIALLAMCMLSLTSTAQFTLSATPYSSNSQTITFSFKDIDVQQDETPFFSDYAFELTYNGIITNGYNPTTPSYRQPFHMNAYSEIPGAKETRVASVTSINIHQTNPLIGTITARRFSFPPMSSFTGLVRSIDLVIPAFHLENVRITSAKLYVIDDDAPSSFMRQLTTAVDFAPEPLIATEMTMETISLDFDPELQRGFLIKVNDIQAQDFIKSTITVEFNQTSSDTTYSLPVWINHDPDNKLCEFEGKPADSPKIEPSFTSEIRTKFVIPFHTIASSAEFAVGDSFTLLCPGWSIQVGKDSFFQLHEMGGVFTRLVQPTPESTEYTTITHMNSFDVLPFAITPDTEVYHPFSTTTLPFTQQSEFFKFTIENIPLDRGAEYTFRFIGVNIQPQPPNQHDTKLITRLINDSTPTERQFEFEYQGGSHELSIDIVFGQGDGDITTATALAIDLSILTTGLGETVSFHYSLKPKGSTQRLIPSRDYFVINKAAPIATTTHFKYQRLAPHINYHRTFFIRLMQTLIALDRQMHLSLNVHVDTPSFYSIQDGLETHSCTLEKFGNVLAKLENSGITFEFSEKSPIAINSSLTIACPTIGIKFESDGSKNNPTKYVFGPKVATIPFRGYNGWTVYPQKDTGQEVVNWDFEMVTKPWQTYSQTIDLVAGVVPITAGRHWRLLFTLGPNIALFFPQSTATEESLLHTITAVTTSATNIETRNVIKDIDIGLSDYDFYFPEITGTVVKYHIEITLAASALPPSQLTLQFGLESLDESKIYSTSISSTSAESISEGPIELKYKSIDGPDKLVNTLAFDIHFPQFHISPDNQYILFANDTYFHASPTSGSLFTKLTTSSHPSCRFDQRNVAVAFVHGTGGLELTFDGTSMVGKGATLSCKDVGIFGYNDKVFTSPLAFVFKNQETGHVTTWIAPPMSDYRPPGPDPTPEPQKLVPYDFKLSVPIVTEYQRIIQFRIDNFPINKGRKFDITLNVNGLTPGTHIHHQGQQGYYFAETSDGTTVESDQKWIKSKWSGTKLQFEVEFPSQAGAKSFSLVVHILNRRVAQNGVDINASVFESVQTKDSWIISNASRKTFLYTTTPFEGHMNTTLIPTSHDKNPTAHGFKFIVPSISDTFDPKAKWIINTNHTMFAEDAPFFYQDGPAKDFTCQLSNKLGTATATITNAESITLTFDKLKAIEPNTSFEITCPQIWLKLTDTNKDSPIAFNLKTVGPADTDPSRADSWVILPYQDPTKKKGAPTALIIFIVIVVIAVIGGGLFYFLKIRKRNRFERETPILYSNLD